MGGPLARLASFGGIVGVVMVLGTSLRLSVADCEMVTKVFALLFNILAGPGLPYPADMTHTTTASRVKN